MRPPAATSPLPLALALAATLCACTGSPPGEDGTAPGGDPASDQDTETTDQEATEDEQPADPGEFPPLIAPGCTAKVTLAGYPTWLHFVRPDRPCSGTVGTGVDHHAINELIRLIGSVPAGGQIDGHIFNITIDAVGKALVDAQNRGVTVRISTDGQVGASSDPVKTQYLDQLSGIVYCGTSANTSCVGRADGAISHTKLFVFSSATSPDAETSTSVVWFGSANQTVFSGKRLYNNTVTIYGDAPLYDRMRGYLDDLRGQRRQADYYDPSSGRGHVLAQSADIYISPEDDSDLVVNRLDDITPDATCRVRVMQASIRDSRLDVVQRLVAMKRGGCQIQVVADTLEPQALAALKAADIAVREAPIHDKVFVVYGRYGAAYQYRVYTGSHNLSGSANTRFDEIFVKLAAETEAAHPVYDAYVTHFDDAYTIATPR